MKTTYALRKLAEISASQWGMITSAQAAAHGVTRLELSRLARAGDLTRLAHGIYKDTGAPSAAYLDVRAAWLSSDPTRLASDRLGDGQCGVVISGQTAAWLHNVGDLRSNRTELTAPVRRQTQRADLHYRLRELSEGDVTIREGLPVTTLERTIADLVEDRTDLSIVANALRDAIRKSALDLELLADKLAPLAERNGHRKSDGAALLDQLLAITGIDQATIADEIASLDGLGVLVARNYLARILKLDFTALHQLGAASGVVENMNAAINAQMNATTRAQITRIVAALAPAIKAQIRMNT